MTTKTIGVLVAAGIAITLAAVGSTDETDPPTGPPIVLESICDYERGLLCDATCPGATGCPVADSGWLCCNDAGTCVPIAIDGACSGTQGNIKGKCEFYTIKDGNAECHDTAT